jgi:creatinine amidohydrolase/Fe(II)-dependent formamide hydrolase-like protein
LEVKGRVLENLNQTSQATAVAIGYGGPIQKDESQEFFDWHAGVEETSMILYCEPRLARMERAEKPVIHFTPRMEELRELAKKNPDLMTAWNALLGTPVDSPADNAHLVGNCWSL